MMRSLLYIVILLVITGCTCGGDGYARGLDEAEAMMHSDPGEALARLNGMDVTAMDDSATMARWALLYSEAMVANRLVAPTDTIVNIAIEYYGNHNLRDRLNHASRLKAILKSGGETNALASALYLQKEKEFMLYKERMARQRDILITLIILLIAIGAIAWQRQRMRLHVKENERLLAEASSLKDEIYSRHRELERIEGQLAETLTSRFDVIDGLCETYYESQGTKAERKAIVDKVKASIESLQSDAGLFAEMESAVNTCRDNALEKLKKEWPEIKPQDYKLYVYLASGLSNRTIALLLGESIEVIYKRKSRLKSRLSERFGSNDSNTLLFK